MTRLNPAEIAAVEAQLELLRRAEREIEGPRYDWYGDECGCAIAPGDCPDHPEGCNCPAGLGQCRAHPRARPDQRPPGTYRAASDREDWRIWLIEAGRGFGKTRCAAEFVVREAQARPGLWVALISETVGDVRDVMIEHPTSGLLAVSPPWFKPTYYPSLARVEWPNGSYGTIYSAEAPGKLRGPEFGLAWSDEFAKWEIGQKETYNNLMMCLRKRSEHGTRAVFSTTPKASPTYKALRANRRVAISGGSTRANLLHLAPEFIEDVYDEFGGTRLGDQELEAVMREDVPGALWQEGLIEPYRRDRLPDGVTLVRVVVAVDPSVGSQDPDSAAECGIVVAGRGSDSRGYVLHDGSMKGLPGQWGARAVNLLVGMKADRIVAEINNGGKLVEFVIRTVDPNASYRDVWASRGKQTRAEPVAALYEQGKISHIGRFPELEQQCCSWVVGDPSPDRMDALVWALTELMLGQRSGGSPRAGGERTMLQPAGGRRTIGLSGSRPKAGVNPWRRRR